MSFEGVWTAEVFSPYGWDSHGVLLFQDGRLVGGDNRQCTSGTYAVHGQSIEADLMVDHYDQPRTIFGEKARKYRARITGRLNGGVISGIVVRPDRPAFELQIRLTRRMDLPGHDRASSGRLANSADDIDLDDSHPLRVLQ